MHREKNTNKNLQSTECQIDISALETIIKDCKGVSGGLIPLLQRIQDQFTFIPRQAFKLIDKELNIPESESLGVATFYTQFKLNPTGKYTIKICKGTACHVQNASKIFDAISEYLQIKAGETTDDQLFTLERVSCLGCCSLAPAIMIGEETYGKLDDRSVISIIQEIQSRESK